MAFVNADKEIHYTRDDKSAASASTLERATSAALVPWVFTAFSGGQGAGGAESKAYYTLGRDTHSIIVYAPTGKTLPASFSLEIWGSHTNTPGSWVRIGSAITAAGEVKFTGQYAYIVISIISLTTPNDGLWIDFSSYRAG